MHISARDVVDLLQSPDLQDDNWRDCDDETRRALADLIDIHQANALWRRTSQRILGVAQKINNSQDSAEIFASIVQSVREIIGSDIGYISLNDENAGETRVLATAGVNTEQFRNIRMPIGTGILGLVAESGRPCWTRDHSRDPEVTHIADVDEAVAAEGIKAILGAPLIIGGVSVGALLVGDRSPRNFTHDEVSALEFLAAITSGALENTRRYEEQSASLSHLVQSHLTQSDKLELLRRLSELDRKFLRLLGDHSKRENLRTALSEATGLNTWIWRADEVFPQPSNVESTPSDVLEAMNQVNTAGEQVNTPGLLAVPVRRDTRTIGGICVVGEIGDYETTAVSRAASVLEVIETMQESILAATSRKISDLLHAVSLGKAGSEEKERLRQLTGVTLNSQDKPFFVLLQDENGTLTESEIEDKVVGRTAIARHQDHFCVLIQGADNIDDAFAELLAPQQKDRIFAGAASLAADRPELTAHALAAKHLEAAVSLGIVGRIVRQETFGSIGLILGSDRAALRALEDQTIGKIIQHDSLHSTELEETMRCYFREQMTVSLTAKALRIHPNTVRQRLDKISALLGPDWRTGARSLDIQIALRIRAIM